VNARRVTIELGTAVVAGWATMALPVLLDPGMAHHEAVFLPFMADVVEGMKPYSLPLLFGVGVVVGVVGVGPSWLLGYATVATLPVWSVLDMAMGGTGHNLLPIEWFLYGVYGTFAATGALIGRLIKRSRKRAQVGDEGAG